MKNVVSAPKGAVMGRNSASEFSVENVAAIEARARALRAVWLRDAIRGLRKGASDRKPIGGLSPAV